MTHAKGAGFASCANERFLPAQATDQPPEKNAVVFVSHQPLLVDKLADSQELTARFNIRRLIRNGGVDPLPTGILEREMQGASGLILCPCRMSMHPGSKPAIVEERAVEIAKECRMRIIICVSAKAEAFPQYMERLAGHVSAVISFGLALTQQESGYLHVWHYDLLALEKNVRPMVDAQSRRGQQWEQFPKNVENFAYTFEKMISSEK